MCTTCTVCGGVDSAAGFDLPGKSAEIIVQNRQRYAALTVKDPFKAPFSVIPNAYKTLMSYMQMNGLQLKYEKEVLTCFERVYSPKRD